MSTPLIAHWPLGITALGYVRAPSYLIDVMPTLIELAGEAYPIAYQGNAIPPLEGRSFAPAFIAGECAPHAIM